MLCGAADADSGEAEEVGAEAELLASGVRRAGGEGREPSLAELRASPCGPLDCSMSVTVSAAFGSSRRPPRSGVVVTAVICAPTTEASLVGWQPMPLVASVRRIRRLLAGSVARSGMGSEGGQGEGGGGARGRRSARQGRRVGGGRCGPLGLATGLRLADHRGADSRATCLAQLPTAWAPTAGSPARLS